MTDRAGCGRPEVTKDSGRRLDMRETNVLSVSNDDMISLNLQRAASPELYHIDAVLEVAGRTSTCKRCDVR